MPTATPYLVPPERLEVPEHGLVIRGWLPGDGGALSEALNASYEHLRPWMPWVVPHQSVEQSERYCRECRGRWLQASDFALAIWDADEPRVLGGSGFHLREGKGFHAAEIGMWIRADACGGGLGTAALAAIAAWGLSDWPFQRLSWRCSGDNIASQRTAERAGFTREGVLRAHALGVDGQSIRDTVCYAALREGARSTSAG